MRSNPGLSLVFAVVLVGAASGQESGTTRLGELSAGQQSPLPSADNKATVLVFSMGLTCVRCNEQITELAKHQADLRRRNVDVLIVSPSGTDHVAKPEGFPFALIADPELNLLRSLGYQDGARHVTLLLDNAGNVRWKNSEDTPFMDVAVLFREIDRLPTVADPTAGSDEDSLAAEAECQASCRQPEPSYTENRHYSRQELLRFLCEPEGLPIDAAAPSPAVTPFEVELFIPPIAKPVSKDTINPPPNPADLQHSDQYPPQCYYEQFEEEILWEYHTDPPYDRGTWSWGINGSTPGPTFHVQYECPILVRRHNTLPPRSLSKLPFALPETTRHLHNAHTASSSDGYPLNYITRGRYWDHHYINHPSGFTHTDDPEKLAREKLTTLWYHDHRDRFTAANVYAGLDGFYLHFDEQDTGEESDPPPAWGLPSGKHDIPLILHDLRFDENAQLVFPSLDTRGILGDRLTVNRRIQPYHEVEPRKYRFRILNGGPSRFYQIFLRKEGAEGSVISDYPFTVITGDGNLLPEPVEANSIFLSVGQRSDVILDFSQYEPGDQVYLTNRLEHITGKGPSGRLINEQDLATHQHDLMQFRIVPATGEDRSRIPTKFRELPAVPANVAELRHRLWVFDESRGQWRINGETMHTAPQFAAIKEGTGEVWTFRNAGIGWSHPIHSHLTEFMVLEVNGVPMYRSDCQVRRRVVDDRAFERVFTGMDDGAMEYKPGRNRLSGEGAFFGGCRRDVATLLPGDEIKVYMEWKDFIGEYVIHCHNVVHEDHSMMLRWDVLKDPPEPWLPWHRDHSPPAPDSVGSPLRPTPRP